MTWPPTEIHSDQDNTGKGDGGLEEMPDKLTGWRKGTNATG